VRTWPSSKRYTFATIYNGFIRKTKILEQWCLVIPPEYLLKCCGLLRREPLLINFFIGTIVIRLRCICTGKRDGLVHCLLHIILVEIEITHIVVMEIKFVVILLVLIMILLESFVLVV
jgi:hypothetical protein